MPSPKPISLTYTDPGDYEGPDPQPFTVVGTEPGGGGGGGAVVIQEPDLVLSATGWMPLPNPVITVTVGGVLSASLGLAKVSGDDPLALVTGSIGLSIVPDGVAMLTTSITIGAAEGPSPVEYYPSMASFMPDGSFSIAIPAALWTSHPDTDALIFVF